MKYKGGRFRRSGEGGLEGGRVGEFKGVGGGGGGGGGGSCRSWRGSCTS